MARRGWVPFVRLDLLGRKRVGKAAPVSSPVGRHSRWATCVTSLPSPLSLRRRTAGTPEASLPRGPEPARGPVPSGRLVRLRVLDRGVRLAAAGLPNGAVPLQRHEGGVHRLLALVVVLLEEGVEVGGIRCSTRAALDKLVPSSRARWLPRPSA